MKARTSIQTSTFASLATIAAAFMFPAFAHADKSALSPIKLASEMWEGKTNPDGSGLFWDLIRETFKLANIDIEFEIVPYARSTSMVRNGHADAWVASYMDEEDWAVYPKHHFDVDSVIALISAEMAKDWKGQTSLQGKRVAWVRGYDYDQYLTVTVNKMEVDTRESGLALIRRERIDAFIDDKDDLTTEINSLGFNMEGHVFKDLMELPLYLGFAPNERGRELSRIFDQHFPTLVASGKAKELFQKHGVPYLLK